ncbi:hypothetical protein H6G33_09945 [Calothrix sp. FACHB-1219]|uniref:hypothetical protein n=1 Tax=unclassified Calothrix TaxID=2619626 RepID=UPI001684FC36|nr:MULTISPECIES: hypothetical protein [unclassified Calothrix]MBD2201668.1 hypothetical protein [Calothrix sp. FACHB-168]MBD2217354.1 hypothetical protein [Calothrix sp. FACHB-1219]
MIKRTIISLVSVIDSALSIFSITKTNNSNRDLSKALSESEAIPIGKGKYVVFDGKGEPQEFYLEEMEIEVEPFDNQGYLP